MRFFYNETLGWDEHKLFIPPRRKTVPLAEVFSPEEVVRLIRAARGLKQRVLLMSVYSAGLRVSELVSLKITDIDPARMTLRVRQGKGGKDRYAILSENLLVELRSIQFLMGHTSLLSTQRYLKLRPQNVDRAQSPLDRLPFTTV